MRCSICLLEMVGNQRTTACNHTFHTGCLEQWLRQSSTCPLCRSALPSLNAEDDDETDAEDEGMVVDEFDVFLYAPSEMLPLYFFFQAICLSRFPNSDPRTMRRIVPGLFQMMMDVVAQDAFDCLIEDDDGWNRQEVINAFFEGEWDDDAPIRAYCYDADMDPSLHRMIAIYESFMTHTGIEGDGYALFEAFLSRLNDQEQYLLFRTSQYQSFFQSLGIRRN